MNEIVPCVISAQVADEAILRLNARHWGHYGNFDISHSAQVKELVIKCKFGFIWTQQELQCLLKSLYFSFVNASLLTVTANVYIEHIRRSLAAYFSACALF